MLGAWANRWERCALVGGFAADKRGNFALITAVCLVPVALAAAVSVEYVSGRNFRSNLQQLLDAAVLAGAAEDDNQAAAAQAFFEASLPGDVNDPERPTATFTLGEGVLDATATAQRLNSLGTGFLGSAMAIGVKSQARFETPQAGGPCVTVLANQGQALLVNSGADISASGCEMHVHSQQNPAFIMNSGSTLDMKKLCVKGHNYINNGGTISKLETDCATTADPYAGTIPEPTLPGSCTTSGAKDGSNHSLNPGMHCWVNFNGNPTITFKPGLHIIRGSMNINSGSTVNAEGVTFYFPDTDSKIQANGNLTMKATAPTSGTYKGILMFEKVSDPTNNANKRQYVFNGSNDEYLEGIIHLPNRDVTYNSTTNIKASKLDLIVNTLIINSANWNFQGFSGGGSGEKTVYLSR